MTDPLILTVSGRVHYIGAIKRIASHKSLATIVIQTDKGKALAADAWDGMIEHVSGLRIGDYVQARVNVISRQNNKDKSLWFTKMTLTQIIKLDQHDNRNQS